MESTTKTTHSEAIAQAVATLAEQLQQGNSAALTAHLSTIARFYDYSFGNILLIASQRPSATRVAGFHAWKSLGRSVRKGEKAIRILAPIVAKRKDEAAASEERKTFVAGFRSVCVFDMAQTDGAELPAFSEVDGDAGDTIEKLTAFCEERGITLTYSDNLDGADGMSYRGAVKILAGMSTARTCSVLAHELAHELLHKGERRTSANADTRELEAEAVAYVVGAAIGLQLNTASADYIKLYNGDADALGESLASITRASTLLLDAITGGRRKAANLQEAA